MAQLKRIIVVVFRLSSGKSGVLVSIPGLATCFRFSFRLFKKGSCQLLAKLLHEALVNRLGGLSLPRKSVVRLSDHPYMTLDVYRGRKTTIQQQKQTIFVTKLAELVNIMNVCLLRSNEN